MPLMRPRRRPVPRLQRHLVGRDYRVPSRGASEVITRVIRFLSLEGSRVRKRSKKCMSFPPLFFFFFYVYLCMMCTNCRQGGWSFRTCQNSHQCRRWSQTRSQGQHRCHQRRTSCPRPHRCSLPQVGAQDAPIEEFHRGPVAAAQLAEP